MMCGGFSCSKNTLLGLNIVYVLVSFLLIGVATYGKTSNAVTSLPLVGGIVASGVFLLFVAILGLIATIKHNQVWLFFYMVILFLIFVIQFSVACACIGVDKTYEDKIITKGWGILDDNTKLSVEKTFECCGLHNQTTTDIDNCQVIPACKSTGNTTSCPTCWAKIEDKVDYAFSASGGVGLFFSFVELVALIVTVKIRREIKAMSPLPE